MCLVLGRFFHIFSKFHFVVCQCRLTFYIASVKENVKHKWENEARSMNVSIVVRTINGSIKEALEQVMHTYIDLAIVFLSAFDANSLWWNEEKKINTRKHNHITRAHTYQADVVCSHALQWLNRKVFRSKEPLYHRCQPYTSWKDVAISFVLFLCLFVSPTSTDRTPTTTTTTKKEPKKEKKNKIMWNNNILIKFTCVNLLLSFRIYSSFYFHFVAPKARSLFIVISCDSKTNPSCIPSNEHENEKKLLNSSTEMWKTHSHMSGTGIASGSEKPRQRI